jgi:hypothetical protein
MRPRVELAALVCSTAAAVSIEQFILDPDINHQHQPRAIA